MRCACKEHLGGRNIFWGKDYFWRNCYRLSVTGWSRLAKKPYNQLHNRSGRYRSYSVAVRTNVPVTVTIPDSGKASIRPFSKRTRCNCIAMVHFSQSANGTA